MLKQMAAVAGSVHTISASAVIKVPVRAIPTGGSAASRAVRSESRPVDRTPASPRLYSQEEAAKLAKRDHLILANLSLVKAIAIRVHGSLPVHVELDDLIHSGIFGLIDAAIKFDAEKQVTFPTYAKHRIKGAILDSLRQLDWASRDMRKRQKQVEAATLELAATLQRTPTEQEIAERLAMDLKHFRSMMIELRNIQLCSASTRSNENDDLPVPEPASKPEMQPESICARVELRGVLRVAIETLPVRYQKVVTLYYTNEMTMKEIGGTLGINESRVSQIHKAALEKMAFALQANGINSSQAF